MPSRKSVTPRRKRSTRPRRAARKPARRKKSRGFRWRYLFVGLALVAVGYVVYLDYTIRDQFEGKRWALPAKVYARALEIYPGKQLPAAQLVQELELLGYRENPGQLTPGSYQRRGNRLRFTTRAFQFWDGRERSRQLEAVFSDGVLTRLQDQHGAELSLLRLEPPAIGGIYPGHREERVLVRLLEVPPLLQQALVAVEDRAFYAHPGINPKAIARALVANLRAGRTVQGGSTLTQQLVKNFFLTNERSLWRKANEAVMALLLEWHYAKTEILEAYINEIYLGQDKQRAIHGFGLAAHYYFDKPLAALDAGEIATLVALARGPSYYHPERHPQRLRQRRNLVIDILEQDNGLDPARAQRARNQPLGIVRGKPGAISDYPAFMDLVRRQLREQYREADLTSEGLQIFTTLDPAIQRRAEQSLSRRITALDRQHGLDGGLQGAAVITSTSGGEVLALVGDRQARYAGFNRALEASRPIGSLIKPAVYLTALDRPQQYTLATPVEDAPITLEADNGTRWSPRNYSGESHGRIPLFRGLVNSYNQATVRLGMQLGFEPIADTLQRMGAPRSVPAYPSMLLGAVNFTPYEVAGMYQTLAAGGFRSPLRAIREVLGPGGEPLRRYPLNVEQTLNVDSVQLLHSALLEVPRSGTARALPAMLPAGQTVAGKTGTTDDLRDSWFAGFSGSHLGVVWLGRDDNGATGLTGASGAMRIWGDIFAELPGMPLEPPPNPGIEYHWFDSQSGLISRRDCPGAAYLAFIKGTAPQEKIDCAGGGVRDKMDSTLDWLKGWFQ
ncbi:penicillin-binding protein 1B [Thiohalophilus thiocyanatoxydans]|uniref:Penicillin-binding protein 1B n=1 Tax=Thiohalophilus thiocyanatoxydans TaxID=381308 RepID=A0A4R8IJ86_9GAMM|nr:penicillin-binding protein 1B [Thiohalophilus thiocyanatoxydans]TDY00094.1 penicillin-binding protein 1B [Thiohalophilus thiocyanatoxydans]